jgi:hypothetical protein
VASGSLRAFFEQQILALAMISKDDVSVRELPCGAGSRRVPFCDASLSVEEEGPHRDQVPQTIVVDRPATLLSLAVRARVSAARRLRDDELVTEYHLVNRLRQHRQVLMFKLAQASERSAM